MLNVDGNTLEVRQREVLKDIDHHCLSQRGGKVVCQIDFQRDTPTPIVIMGRETREVIRVLATESPVIVTALRNAASDEERGRWGTINVHGTNRLFGRRSPSLIFMGAKSLLNV